MSEIKIGRNPINGSITKQLEKYGIEGDFKKYDKMQECLFILFMSEVLTESENIKIFNRIFKKLVNDLKNAPNYNQGDEGRNEDTSDNSRWINA